MDVFFHDGLHTYENMRFELNLAKRCVRPGGIIIADNVEFNSAFTDELDSTPNWKSAELQYSPERKMGVARRAF